MDTRMQCWVIVVLVGLTGCMSRAEQPAPATQPGQTWERGEIVSPKARGAGVEGRIGKLIEAHNAARDRIGRGVLRGDCVWTLDMEGQPRAMAIVYERTGGRGEIECGEQRCRVEGMSVRYEAESAVYLDALYLLAFRTFDPKGFREAPIPATRPGGGGAKREEGPRIRAQAEKETLDFEEATGHLVRAEWSTEHGPLVAHFSQFQVLPGDAKVAFPTLIEVTVPAEMYPFPRPWEGKMRLKVDPARSELNAPRTRGE